MSKIVNESILVFSLKILFGSSLHFVSIRVFIVMYVRNVKSQFSAKQGILATWPRNSSRSRDNKLVRLSFLSCSVPTIVTLQLPACFTCVAFWRVASCESLTRSCREKPLNAHILEFLHTLSHTTLT